MGLRDTRGLVVARADLPANKEAALNRDASLRLVKTANGHGRARFPLSAICRNEMYFLPEFLSHYRNIGIDHFVFLDDRSTDGTPDYLASQPDVSILASDFTYGTTVVPSSGPFAGKSIRMQNLWRNQLLDEYCSGGWAIHCDLDEFLSVPEGRDLPGLVADPEISNGNAVYCAMLDMYPETIRAQDDLAFSPSDGWFFDATQHISVRPNSVRIVYPGARARLFHEHGLSKNTLGNALKSYAFGYAYPKLNNVRKPVLIRVDGKTHLRSSHAIFGKSHSTAMLALKHFKFCGDLRRRVKQFQQEKAHVHGSREYASMDRLLDVMEAKGASFLGAISQPADTHRRFVDSGNSTY